MININEYVRDGNVDRILIVSHIKNRILKGGYLKEVISNKDVQSAFIGKTFTDKTDETTWNEEYLNRLGLVAVAESFNEDYLVYLDKVAEYVASKNGKSANNMMNVLIVLLVLIMLCGVGTIAIFTATK